MVVGAHHKRNSVYITFHCGLNEMSFRFGGAPRKTDHSANFISGIVYMTFYHPMKFHFWQNDRNEMRQAKK